MAGVIDEDVKSAEFSGGVIDQPSRAGAVGEITRYGAATAGERINLRPGSFEFVGFGLPVHRNPGAGPSERDGDRPSDATARTRD